MQCCGGRGQCHTRSTGHQSPSWPNPALPLLYESGVMGLFCYFHLGLVHKRFQGAAASAPVTPTPSAPSLRRPSALPEPLFVSIIDNDWLCDQFGEAQVLQRSCGTGRLSRMCPWSSTLRGGSTRARLLDRASRKSNGTSWKKRALFSGAWRQAYNISFARYAPPVEG